MAPPRRGSSAARLSRKRTPLKLPRFRGQLKTLASGGIRLLSWLTDDRYVRALGAGSQLSDGVADAHHGRPVPADVGDRPAPASEPGSTPGSAPGEPRRAASLAASTVASSAHERPRGSQSYRQQGLASGRNLTPYRRAPNGDSLSEIKIPRRPSLHPIPRLPCMLESVSGKRRRPR